MREFLVRALLNHARRRAIPAPFAPALLALALAACTPPDTFAPACPRLNLLKDTADLTRFDGRGEDVTDLVLSARIAAVPASCKQGDAKNIVHADMQVVFDLVRGPALHAARVDLPFFVAVTDPGGRIIDKQSYLLPVPFTANSDRVRVASDPIALDFPTSQSMHAPDYHLYVGLVLSADELAYNRRAAAK